jgi:hypothetical protein
MGRYPENESKPQALQMVLVAGSTEIEDEMK